MMQIPPDESCWHVVGDEIQPFPIWHFLVSSPVVEIKVIRICNNNADNVWIDIIMEMEEVVHFPIETLKNHYIHNSK